MAAITEADVRQYVQDATSAEDIERAIAMVLSDLPECRVLNAALVAIAIAQGRMQQSTETVEQGADRQLLHRALQRSLRLPR